MGWMNTPEDIFADAYTYIMIISGGIAAMVFYNLFSAYLRAVGNSQAPLFFLVFSACLNIVLDLVFIVVFKLGVAGAALATVVAQGVSAVLCGGYIILKVNALTPETGQWRLNSSDSKHQLSMGLPMAFQFAITASGGMVMQSAINLFGSNAVAAYTAAGKLEALVEQGMVAMGQAVATYGGQNFGKGDIERIKAGVKAALGAIMVYGAVAAIVVSIGLEPAISIFFAEGVDMAAMMPWARTYMNICASFFLPLSTIFVFRNVMQGCGYGFLPMMGGFAELVARLTVAVIAMKVGSYALAVFCHPAAWTAAAVFTGVSYVWVMKDIVRRKKE
ncbi:MAG: polysaccharide biosynthesis C-terminal domain-containing protein [Lachnospiraceae bacterium]|nr:polysaccharide biosynthesis C-terminal domain-containing protein [Lachnospiraceae bacterium]